MQSCPEGVAKKLCSEAKAVTVQSCPEGVAIGSIGPTEYSVRPFSITAASPQHHRRYHPSFLCEAYR